MYQKTHISEDTHNAFVDKYGGMTQKTYWAKVKQGWTSERIAMLKDGEINSVALILYKTIPFTLSKICYVPRGPVCQSDNPDDYLAIIKEIKKSARKKGALNVKFDPFITSDNTALMAAFKAAGYIHHGLAKGFKYIQPNHVMIAKLAASADAFWSELPAQTRNMIQKCQDHGFVCHKASKAELPAFQKLMNETGERHEMTVRSRAYFENLIDAYTSADEVDFFLTKLIPEKFKQSIIQENDDITKDKNKLERKLEKPLSDKKITNIQSELAILNKRLQKNQILSLEMDELLRQGVTEVPLAGGILIYSGDTANYLYGATSDAYAHYYAGYLSVWTMMQEAIQRHKTYFDFGGVSGYTGEEAKEDGLYLFKRKFNGELFSTIGEWDTIINPPLYRGLKIILKARKKGIHRVQTFKHAKLKP